MPIINSYSDDGELINSINEPLNEHNLESFINEDLEKAMIYLEALAEFTDAIKEMAFDFLSNGAPYRKAPYMARKLVTEFYHHNSNILELSKKIMDDKATQKPTVS